MLYISILLNVWLHSYSYTWVHWHNKHDAIYQKQITDKGLDNYGVTLDTFRAIAIIESGQRETLKGGGHNLFWGVFQISSTLAEKFGEYKHKEMLDVTKNTEVFASWMKYYIETWLNPMKKDRKKKGLKPLTDKQWTAILYWSHNMGPGIAKYAVRKKYPTKWILGHLKRRYSHLYDRKERIYRVMLGVLAHRLKEISKANTIEPDKSKIPWWSKRRELIKSCFKVKRKLTWRRTTKTLLDIQNRFKLSKTGVWDTITENRIISFCKVKE